MASPSLIAGSWLGQAKTKSIAGSQDTLTRSCCDTWHRCWCCLLLVLLYLWLLLLLTDGEIRNQGVRSGPGGITVTVLSSPLYLFAAVFFLHLTCVIDRTLSAHQHCLCPVLYTCSHIIGHSPAVKLSFIFLPTCNLQLNKLFNSNVNKRVFCAMFYDNKKETRFQHFIG